MEQGLQSVGVIDSRGEQGLGDECPDSAVQWGTEQCQGLSLFEQPLLETMGVLQAPPPSNTQYGGAAGLRLDGRAPGTAKNSR